MAEHPTFNVSHESWPEIPGYRIDAVIGRGATGVVYRARQLAVDRPVALKVLHRELAGRGQAIRRLQREARTTARLAHPSIVSAIDMGETRGQWWYAMELVEGDSLAQRLKSKGRLTERETLKLAIALCEALQHAHEHGVVHRDIKPANILVDQDGRPHLVDLGLAFAEDDPAITRHGGTLGTPHYISPEQARNPQGADIRSDIWSLGATLYHALCGRPPFAGASVAEILSGVLYARIEDPRELASGLSKGMGLVLRKCLSRAPERRYQTPREMLEDLELLRERRDVGVRASALDPLAGDHGRRRRRTVIGALIAATSILGATIWWLASDPVAGVGEPPALEASAGAVWPTLEAIDAASRRGESHLARALIELAQLQPVPERYRDHYARVVADVHERYRAAIAHFATQVQAELDRHLLERDFVSAAHLVERDFFERRLRATFDPSPTQLAELHERLRDEDLRVKLATRLEDEIARDVGRAERRLLDQVLPEVQRLEARAAWRSARGEIEHALAETLQGAQTDGRRLPAEHSTRLSQSIFELFHAPRAELEERWRAFDRELEAFVAERSREVEAELRARRLRGDSAATLRESFQARLAQIGLEDDQFLTGVSRVALDRLEQEALRLAAVERGLIVQDAATWVAQTERDAREDWRRRDLDAVRARWMQGREKPWLADKTERIELELDWVALVESLFARAAERVRIAEGKSLAILLGGIETTGIVRGASDPLRSTFTLEPPGATKPLVLALTPSSNPAAQLLGADTIERLAGLPASSGEIADPTDRLSRVLLRVREGDSAVAASTLRSGPLPRERFPALVRMLEDLLAPTSDAASSANAERASRSRDLLSLIQRTADDPAENAANLKRIDHWLDDFGDLPEGAETARELEVLRERLTMPVKPQPSATPSLDDLKASRVEVGGGRAKLTFDFFGPPRGAWSSGDWLTEPDGWRAGAIRSRAQLVEDEVWPRMPLSAPLDLGAKLEVELEFQQLEASGPPRLLALSVAGWHTVFAGPARPGEPARYAVATGDATALRTLIEQALAGKGQIFPGFKRGAAHRLSVTLSHQRGRIALALDGAPFAQSDAVRPNDARTPPAIVVRSIEPIRLRTLRIDAEVD